MLIRLVLLGPPGAGKGTQAELVCKKFGVPHISTGEMLRSAVAKGDLIGKIVSETLDKGHLVPDALMIELMKIRLSNDDCKSGFVLDGFPRTVEQAEAITKLLTEIEKPITHVIEVTVPDAVLIGRVELRSKNSGRSDDTTDVIAKRLEVYWRQTKPVSAFYKALGVVHLVDGLGTVDEVQARINAALS